MNRRLTALRRPLLFVPITAALVLGATLTWWLWPARTAPALVAAHDYSGRPSVCVAADDSPATATLFQHTWTVVQQAAKESSVNAQQLVVPVGDAKTATPYLAGLSAQHCTLVVTVGPAFDTAVPSVLKDAPGTRFIVIAPPPNTDLAGATTLSEDQLATDLANTVRSLTPHQ